MPRVSRYILDAGDVVQTHSFYRQQFLPTLLKQAYPNLVPEPYPTRTKETQVSFQQHPFFGVLDRLECAYLQHHGSHRNVEKEMVEAFGDQAYVFGTIRYLQQFGAYQPTFLYFMSREVSHVSLSDTRV